MKADVEPLVMRRLRSGRDAGSNRRGITGNLLYCDFTHLTARPVGGLADPHLHLHSYVANVTHDGGKFYAAELGEVMNQRASLQAKFEARLARKLRDELGYQPERVTYRQAGRIKSGWELAGIGRKLIEAFSRRTAQVEDAAAADGATTATARHALGAKTRDRKEPGTSLGQLREAWRSRVTEQQREAIARLGGGEGRRSDPQRQRAREAVQYAVQHHLYRQSTVQTHQVVGTALEHAVTLLPEQITEHLADEEFLHRTQEVDGAHRPLLTTREVLTAERRLIAYAREGRGTRRAISDAPHVFKRDWLGEQQKAAVNHCLTSTDAVIAITGGAGTGKSSLMTEAAEAMAAAGKTVHAFAPSRGATEVLEGKGFAAAQTVEHLLRNTQLQEELTDQVIWIDECGLLDVRSLGGVFEIAERNNVRVILSGDTRQHGTARRGEAARLLENEAGLQIARVEKIRRQKGRYRDAVELVSRGPEIVDREGRTGLVAGFDLLDSLGRVREIDGEQRHRVLADQYVDAVTKGTDTLVVCPTHAEGRAVTAQIRDRLREAGRLQPEERLTEQLRSLSLTDAEKTRPEVYHRGMVLQCHQNIAGGYRRGDRFEVVATGPGAPELRPVGPAAARAGVPSTVPLSHPERFEVYEKTTLPLAAGDRVRFTLGGTDKTGKRRIANGRVDTVAGFTAAGDIRMDSGVVITADHGHLAHGFVSTSHAAQGKDRPLAIAALGSESLPAVNAKQIYVTISRGSKDILLYVDDKAAVRRSIERSGEQLSATEMIQQTQAAERNVRVAAESRQRLAIRDRIAHWWRNHFGRREGLRPVAAPAFNLARRPAEPQLSRGM